MPTPNELPGRPLESGDEFIVQKAGNLVRVPASSVVSGVSDGDKGSITVSGGGNNWSLNSNSVTNNALADMPTATFKARLSPGTGDPQDISGAQATSLLDIFTNTLKGLVPASGGGTANFLRADGSWAAPTTNISDGDKGDITVSGSGNTWTIDNDAVTYAKIQNVSATNRLLGRQSAGAGDIEEIPCTAFARTILDDVDAAATRATLGLGTLATQSGSFSGTSSGTNTGDQNLFSRISVSGQSDIVADNPSDILTIAAGPNITITTDAATDTLTISSTGGSGSGDAVVISNINQTAHGFVVGDVIHHDGTAYAKALANAASTADVLGVVSSVSGPNQFTLTTSGVITGLSGLVPGATYFLSDTTPGVFTAIEPTSPTSITKPIMEAVSATSAIIINLRGILIGDGALEVPWGNITGTLSSQTDLQAALDAKQNVITPGTALQYYRGDKTFQTLDTGVVPENGNLYFTNERAQDAVFYNVSGQDGVIFDYDDDANLATIGLTYGTTANTVCEGNDVRLSDARTPLAHTHVAANITDFSEAVDDRVSSLLVAGSNITLTYNDVANTLTIASTGGGGGGGGAVDSVNGQTGVVVLDADDIDDTSTTHKFTTAADITKLAGIEAGAQVNTVNSVAGKTGVVTLVKGDVGLGNVDNTSDLSKPISTATQTALDGKANTSHTHTASQVTDFSEAVDDRVASLLVAGTNITLTYNDTANTLTIDAAGGGGGTPAGSNTQVQFNNGGAFGADGDFTYNATTNTLTVAGEVITGNIQTNTSAGGRLQTNGGSDALGWGFGGSVNGTLYGGWDYDGGTANTILGLIGASKTITSLDTATYPNLTELSYVKGVTSAIQTQINGKENTITAGTTAQYYRGDKTFQTLNTAAVPESGSLYFTDERAQDAVLSVISASGGITYSYNDVANTAAIGITYGTTAGTACQGNDARLSDARTPLAHTHVATDITDSTTAGRAILTAVDAAAQRTSLGLVIGTNVQAQNARLQDIATNLTAASGTVEKTGANTFGTYTVSTFGKNLIDDADATAARTTLGLGTLATQNGTFSGTSSGTNTGDQNLFSTIAVSGQSNVVADSTSDTLTLVAGANVTITTDASTDTITIAASGGGGGSPGGTSGQIQFNNAGSFAGFTASGDATINTGTGAVTISADAVDNTKLANMAANTVKGRAAGTTGDPSDIAIGASQLFGRGSTGDLSPITLGTNLSMSGTTLNATGGSGGGSAKEVRKFTFDGQGSVPAVGTIEYFYMPFGATINSWMLAAYDASGAPVSASAVVDIWKDTNANYPPVVGDSIPSPKPTLSSQNRASSSSLGSWVTTSVAAGDWIGVRIDSISTAAKLVLYLEMTQ